MNKNGSCLLLLTIISSILLLYLLNDSLNSSLQLQIATKRYMYEKVFRLADGLLNFGIAYSKKNFNNLVKESQPLTLHKGNWLDAEDSLLQIVSGASSIYLESICAIREYKCMITALLSKEEIEEKTIFRIYNWHVSNTK